MNTKRTELKRLKYLERKACAVVSKVALASTKFYNDLSSLSFVGIFENPLSAYLTVADQRSDHSCDVADAS